jgi:hypothetical protein
MSSRFSAPCDVAKTTAMPRDRHPVRNRQAGGGTAPDNSLRGPLTNGLPGT